MFESGLSWEPEPRNKYKIGGLHLVEQSPGTGDSPWRRLGRAEEQCGLSMKCLPWVHVFEYFVPRWWGVWEDCSTVGMWMDEVDHRGRP